MQKVAVVSGGSRGIGRQIAKDLVKAGYLVAVIYRQNDAMAQSLLSELNNIDLRAMAIKADVSSYDDVGRAIDAVHKAFGQIDLLVNNAGVAHSGLLMDMSPEEWDRVLSTNLTGAFYLSRLAARDMCSSGGGCIVNISSVWGVYGASCEVAYSASKAGLIGMTKALSRELGASHVRVNCISCGLIDTDMNKMHSVDDMAALVDITPLNRIGTPQDVSDACLFLASSKASFITGENIEVSGGFRGW